MSHQWMPAATVSHQPESRRVFLFFDDAAKHRADSPDSKPETTIIVLRVRKHVACMHVC